MSYKAFFDEIKNFEPKKRGNEFEKLINKIFDDGGVLVSGRYRTADTEQEIDGAILIFSKIFLIEAKWENSETLAASKLFSFLGKINSKIDGTLGVFISYNQLSENFISSVRNGLKQNCIVIHGEDNITDIIEEKVNLKEYVEYCFIQASTKNRVEVNTSEYLSIPKKVKLNPHASEVKIDKWMEIYESLVGTTSKSDFVAKLELLYPQTENLSERIINIYETIPFNSQSLDKFSKLIEKIVTQERNDFTKCIINMLSGTYWKKIAYENFISILLKTKIVIDKPNQIKIIDNIVEGLNGDWNSENRVSMIIEMFYSQTDLETKCKIAILYLDIYCDTSRLEKFEQKKLANKVFLDLSDINSSYFDCIKSELLKRFKSLKLDEFFYNDLHAGIGELKNFTIRRMIQLYGKVFTDNKIKAKEFLEAEYDKL